MNNKLPIKSRPNQKILTTVQVNGANKDYLLNVVYRDKLEYWTMDIIDYVTNVVILSNIPLLAISDGANNVDIIRQIAYKRIGSLFVIKTSSTDDDSPRFSSIQDSFSIVWGDNFDY